MIVMGCANVRLHVRVDGTGLRYLNSQSDGDVAECEDRPGCFIKLSLWERQRTEQIFGLRRKRVKKRGPRRRLRDVPSCRATLAAAVSTVALTNLS